MGNLGGSSWDAEKKATFKREQEARVERTKKLVKIELEQKGISVGDHVVVNAEFMGYFYGTVDSKNYGGRVTYIREDGVVGFREAPNMPEHTRWLSELTKVKEGEMVYGIEHVGFFDQNGNLLCPNFKTGKEAEQYRIEHGVTMPQIKARNEQLLKQYSPAITKAIENRRSESGKRK